MTTLVDAQFDLDEMAGASILDLPFDGFFGIEALPAPITAIPAHPGFARILKLAAGVVEHVRQVIRFGSQAENTQTPVKRN